MREVRIIKTLKWQEKAHIPPVSFTGGRLKIKIVFCSKLVVLHAKDVAQVET